MTRRDPGRARAIPSPFFILIVGAVWGMAVLVALPAPSVQATTADEEARAMIRPLLSAGEVVASVTIERSDPFGGDPDRETGKLWFIPGRGLRYQSTGKNAQDILADRERQAFFLYDKSQGKVYRAPFERAPARIRALILDPEQTVNRDLRAVPETRTIAGRPRAGYRVRSAGSPESSAVAVWIAADPASKLPRWIAFASEAESLLVELRDATLRKTPRLSDLVLSAPKGTPEEALDPRELLR
ncbi:MAG TPA: hypothetical protein VFV24_04340 [Candidatus Eisenbacteria bacterium]|nr:hypothetical protein [Candidatus Eisenbacteria bacterium]